MRPERIRSLIAHEIGDLPLSFWLLAGGTLLYVLGVYMAFPFSSLFMTERLGISITTTGILFGVMAFLGLPFQFPAGSVADRVGRKPVLALAVVGSMLFCFLMAVAQNAWQAGLAIFTDAAFGWPMYLTASHTVIADLVPPQRRAEAMSIVRTAINAGMALGPLAATPLLGAWGSYRLAFVVGGVVAGLFLVMVLVGIRETRPKAGPEVLPDASPPSPPTIVQPPDPGLPSVVDQQLEAADAVESRGRTSLGVRRRTSTAAQDLSASRGGYRVVLRDRRFLAFSAAMLLPLYGLGQLWVTLPVVMSDLHDTSAGEWGYLMTTFAGTAAVLQYPLVRGVRRRDPLLVLAVAALLLTGGMCGMVLVGGWASYPLMVSVAVGFLVLMPVQVSVVSQLAPIDLRGRYLGLSTFFFLGGYSLGPLLGGSVVDLLGPRGAYLVVAAAGVAGAAALSALAHVLRARRKTPPSASDGRLR